MSQFSQLDILVATLAARAAGDPATSYVAKLLQKGADSIAKKVGEEAVEVAIASTRQQPAELVSESADLLFHLLLLWQAHGIAPAAIMAELARREGISGIAEKAARQE